MATRPKRPRDPNQLGRLIVALSTGEAQDIDPNAGKNPAAVRRGHLGGIKGGTARSAKLTNYRRSEIAKKAANARWSKAKSKQ